MQNVKKWYISKATSICSKQLHRLSSISSATWRISLSNIALRLLSGSTIISNTSPSKTFLQSTSISNLSPRSSTSTCFCSTPPSCILWLHSILPSTASTLLRKWFCIRFWPCYRGLLSFDLSTMFCIALTEVSCSSRSLLCTSQKSQAKTYLALCLCLKTLVEPLSLLWKSIYAVWELSRVRVALRW